MAKNQPGRTWSFVFMLGTPLAVVGAAAMLITFATLIDVATFAGLPFPIAFPVVVDVGMIGLMVTATQLKLRGLSGSWLAYSWFSMLSLVSVVANGTHAIMAADMTRMTPWGAALLGAVPPATLLVMTHVLMKLIPDEKERAKLQTQREKTAVAAQVLERSQVRASTHQPAPSTPSEPLPRRMTPADVSLEPLRLVGTPTLVPNASKEEVIQRVHQHIAETGEKPTGAMVGEWLGGKSPKTGQRLLATISESQQDTLAPDLLVAR